MTYPHPHTKQNAIVAGFSHPKKTYAVVFLMFTKHIFRFLWHQADTKPQLPENALALTQWMTLGLRSAGIVSRVAGS